MGFVLNRDSYYTYSDEKFLKHLYLRTYIFSLRTGKLHVMPLYHLEFSQFPYPQFAFDIQSSLCSLLLYQSKNVDGKYHLKDSKYYIIYIRRLNVKAKIKFYIYLHFSLSLPFSFEQLLHSIKLCLVQFLFGVSPTIL